MALAWSLSRADAAVAVAGGTLVPLTAGLVSIAVLLLTRRSLGLWAWDRAGRAAAPEPTRGVLVGCVIAVGLLVGGNVLRTRGLWQGDWSAVVALLAGAAGWGAVLARGGQRALRHWYGVAAAAALLPVAAMVGVLRPTMAAGPFLSALAFFVVVDAAVLLVTEELAFRRALIGSPAEAGLGAIVFAAIVFGLWHAVQPGYDGSPVWSFVGTALGGFITGCLYVLSGSLTVAALYHALHNAPLKALGGAPVASRHGAVAGALGLALAALIAVWLAALVSRRGGAAPASLS